MGPPSGDVTLGDSHALDATGSYRSSREHVLAHLARLDVLIRAQLNRVRVSQRSVEEFRGLYISEAEIDGLLRQPFGIPVWWGDNGPGLEPTLQAAWRGFCERIEAYEDTTRKRGLSLRLLELAHRFQLTPFDVDALLIAMAPQLDVRYERLYAYIQDDVTKKKASVDLILNIMCSTVESKLDMRARFSRLMPLVSHGLVSLMDDPSHQSPPLLSKYVTVDERIVNYLLEIDEPDMHLSGCATYCSPRAKLDDLYLPAEMKGRLMALARRSVMRNEPMVLYFQGGYGVGKQTTAEALCQAMGLELMVLDLKHAGQTDQATFESVVRRAGREAILRRAALYWRDIDTVLADDKRFWLATLLREWEHAPGLTFVSGTVSWDPSDALRRIPFLRITMPLPTYMDRIHLWTQALTDNRLAADGVDIGALANAFRFSGGQIQDAMTTAQNLAQYRDPEHPVPTMDDFVAASRLQCQRKLAALARKITPHYTWDQIVLPADRLQQLREMCGQARHRSLVYEQWGFDKKLSLGKGLTVLFSGPSGTGKTMAADIMAGELGLDLYKIDLSMVVSKYIGETEKNLSAIFTEAASSNAILFFDEADALFGKRSDVRDSHDRYANIEVGYLLQKMEEYEGIVILATNLRKNMDDAFVRRIHSGVEFPFPSLQDRLRIWETIWPSDTPLSHDVDFNLLASRFDITGGNIRNIALAATFLAAEEGKPVGMTHLLSATRREYQKMGKVTAEEEFSRVQSQPAGQRSRGRRP